MSENNAGDQGGPQAATDRSAVDAMLDEIYGRAGEVAPQPRLSATRAALELLGDPHHAYPIVHITGTNGKTSTSRMIESLLRAHGLRTGLFTSPDLGRLNERIVIDGEPIDDERMIANWQDIKPYLEMADAQVVAAGEPPLTFFEALTVLAYATFADAPIDVGVIEVGLGGEWDSTNVADGEVAVFAPIDLDHMDRLGPTIAAIARTKAGIIKPNASVVSAVQQPEALAELERATDLMEGRLSVEGRDFAVLARTPAVGGQVVDVQGRAERYDGLFLPLLGEHQAHNAAVAIAAVETFLGDGSQAIDRAVLDEGLSLATSPGRLQIAGAAPTLIVDAAHNPHGARALAAALTESFAFETTVAVVAVLADKDAVHMFEAVAGVIDTFIVTTAPSVRASDPDALAAVAAGVVGAARVLVEPDIDRAVEAARALAVERAGEAGGVVAFGSITLIARVLQLAKERGWAP